MLSSKVTIRQALMIQSVSKYSTVLVQLLLAAILARILSPTQYGLIAIVMVFLTFFQVLSDLGIGPAIIQYRDLDDSDYSALFTFSALLGLCLAALFCLASLPIATLYGERDLVGLCCFSSISLFFSSLNMVPNGVLLKRQQFLSVGVRLIVVTVVSGSLAIVLALQGFGTYSLAANAVMSSMFVTVWNLFATRIPVGNIHFMKPLRKVASYSAFQAGFGVVNYFSRNLDNMLIGKALGMEALGIYDKSYRLTTYPNTYLAGIASSVLQPYLAERQNDMGYLYRQWKRVAKILSLVGAPVAVILFSCSEEIVAIMYGSQWMAAVPVLQILSISVYFQVVNNPNGAMFQSANHTDYQLYHSLIATAITVIFLLLGLVTGELLLAALGVSAAYCLHTVSILYFLVRRTFGQKILPYLAAFVPEICIAVATSVVVCLLGSVLSGGAVVLFVEKAGCAVLLFVVGYAATGQFGYLKLLLGRKGKKSDSNG